MLKSGETMRKYLKAYLIPLMIAFVVLFNIFVLNTYKMSPWYSSFTWVALAILAVLALGKRDRTSAKFVDVIQLVFIYCMGYELIIYLSGLVLGFVRSPYSMEPITMIKNISPVLVTIVAQEVVRFLVVSRYSKDKKVIVGITVALIIFEISYSMGAYNLKDASDVLRMLTILVGGSISKNCLCSYLALKTNYKPAILYRAVFELIIYIVPIYPNLGDYIEAMVGILFPIILLVSIIAIFEKKKYRQPKKGVMEMIILWVPTVAIILFIVALQSGVFKYRTMSIGSQSMYPNINKGDVVVIEQYDTDEELRSIVKGEVLVFKHDSIIIVHRVVDIKEKDGRLTFKTKGDNNNSADAYDIDQSLVIGVAKFKIPYIGLPSVWLSETING